MKILVIKPDGIGDLILLVPVLVALKQQNASCSITVVVSSFSKGWLETVACVDRVLVFDRPDRKLTGLEKVSASVRTIKWILLNNLIFYDRVYLPRRKGTLGDKLLCLLSLTKHRISWNDSGWNWMYALQKPVESGVHEVLQMMNLFEVAEPSEYEYSVEINEDNAGKPKEIMGLEGEVYIIVGCNAARIGRRSWPVDYYANVVRQLKARSPDLKFVIVGAGDDVAVAEALIKLTGSYVTSAAGKFSLLETAALMKDAILFIGNDSGPMHMAAAVGVPVVEISCHVQGGDPNHANAPERFGPYGVPHRICRPEKAMAPCIDCCMMEHAHCITAVTPGQVYQAAVELLSSCSAEE
ncbi:glycosyltransferase family 9 protein [Verrucomicrobia bacterium S94]|nr:glycosyltransferase family 9 protein [Verrucomicrobia bacterium S94]